MKPSTPEPAQLVRAGRGLPAQISVLAARRAGDCVVFMDGGVIVEQGRPADVIANPSHPRTRLFLSRFIRG
jgi:ABC-type histidine transport system ATPase subunit